jgi:hypothetical protein
MATPGGASLASSGRARDGACALVAADPWGRDRPSPAGRRGSPGRVVGGRWSVGRLACCGPVRLRCRDPLSGTAGGLDSHAWSVGAAPACFGSEESPSRPVAGGLDRRDWSCGPVGGGWVPLSEPVAGDLGRQDWSCGPVAGRLGGWVPLSGAAGAATGAAGHGVLPGAGWGGADCLCCPTLPMRCEPGLGRASVPPVVAGLPGSALRTARCAPVRGASREPPGAGPLTGAGPPGAGLPRAGPSAAGPLPGAWPPPVPGLPLPRPA